jgi:hypothetical protein
VLVGVVRLGFNVRKGLVECAQPQPACECMRVYVCVCVCMCVRVMCMCMQWVAGRHCDAVKFVKLLDHGL